MAAQVWYVDRWHFGRHSETDLVRRPSLPPRDAIRRQPRPALDCPLTYRRSTCVAAQLCQERCTPLAPKARGLVVVHSRTILAPQPGNNGVANPPDLTNGVGRKHDVRNADGSVSKMRTVRYREGAPLPMWVEYVLEDIVNTEARSAYVACMCVGQRLSCYACSLSAHTPPQAAEQNNSDFEGFAPVVRSCRPAWAYLLIAEMCRRHNIDLTQNLSVRLSPTRAGPCLARRLHQ